MLSLASTIEDPSDCSLVAPAAVPSPHEVTSRVASVEGTIRTIASQYSRGLTSDQVDDLVSAGRVGALIAAQRYDESRNASFNTYAYDWIKAYVVEEAINFWGRGRITSRNDIARQVFFGRGRAKRAIEDVGDKVDHEAVAEAIGVSVARLQDVAAAVDGDDRSFDDPHQLVRGVPLRDVVEDGATEGPSDVLWSFRVRKAVEALDDRSRWVIKLRYFEGMKLEDVGCEIGVTRERARQLVAGALSKLRKVLAR